MAPSPISPDSKTAYTTAKLTIQHGMIYDYLINIFGIEQALQYADANSKAINTITSIINNEQINCDYQTQTAYLYTTRTEEISLLDKEMKAYDKLGITASCSRTSMLPFEVQKTINIKQQAQFHPLKYLYELARIVHSHGIDIFEKSRVYNIDKIGSTYKIKVNDHTVKCDNLVIACHYPFLKNFGMYFLKIHTERSYALAMQQKEPFPGMYINLNNPIHSIRHTPYDKGSLLLLGGENHRTASKEENSSYLELEEFAEKSLDKHAIKYRWSNQDCITLDKVPYIGQMRVKDKGLYIATGYNKWGMTLGTASATIISNMILGKGKNEYNIFKPQRNIHCKSIIEFMKNGIVATRSYFKKLEPSEFTSINSIAKRQGGTLVYKGNKVGIYIDQNGINHTINPVCTHLGCALKFNSAEKTWDCACHGSRFDIDGNVIEGPAVTPLTKINIGDNSKNNVL